ncbi:MAG: ABC transporter substrate-binding protein [Candidatus Zophobacter franzmannii]|nr:ABC transporter substrate-binding protein [Candidatus Zophobacter franzmannii]
MKKIIYLLLIVLVLVGCGKKTDSAKTEIIFWHAMGGPLGEALNELVLDFNMSQDKILVESISVGNYTALSQKLMASIQANKQPDIAQVFESWTANFVEGEVLVNLGDMIESDSTFTDEDMDDIYPVFIESNTLNGELWSLPFNKSVRLLYYNKDSFIRNGINPNSPPETWEQFRAYCKKLTKDLNGNGITDIYGTNMNISAWQFENLLVQAGGHIMKEDGITPAFNSPEGGEALDFICALLNEDKSVYTVSGYDGQNDFLAEKVGMYEGSSVSLAFMRKQKFLFNMGMAPIPHFRTKRNIISGTNVAIFKCKDKKREEAAWEFIKWFSDTEQTAKWSRLTNYMPIRRSSLETDTIKEMLSGNESLAQVYGQLEYAETEPQFAEWYNARKDLEEQVLERVINGLIEPAKALDEAAEKISKDLRKKHK